VNATIALAVGIVRTWVALYTLGLPQLLREARRLEIDCDLWEQRQLAELTREPHLATAIQIVVRALLGIFSDVTWRVEASSARRSRSTEMNDSLIIRALLLAAVAAAAFPVVIGVLVATGVNGEVSTSERLIFGPIQICIGAAIIGGLAISARRPVLGIGLVVAGALAISVMWYWVAVITAPIGVALAAVAYFRARRTGWPNRAGTA